MNINLYDEQIRTLYDAHRALLKCSDPQTGRAARRLLNAAKKLRDDELAGYACHCIAFAAYFIEGNYPSFLKHLRLAATHLRNCENREELVSVYYLVAIDTLRKELFDVSYSYFLIARNLASRYGNKTQAAILDLNIGNIMLQTGQYAKARQMFARSLEGIRNDTSHPHYYVNLIACHINDAMTCFEMGRVAQAGRIVTKISQIMEPTPDVFLYETRFSLILLQARIAHAKQQETALASSLSALHSASGSLAQIAVYMPELQRFFSALLESGHVREAGKLLRMVEHCGIASDATQALRIQTAMRISYYTKTNRKRALLDAYLEQDRVYARIREEQKNLYSYLKSLIELVSLLQQMQTDVTKERAALTQLAETDALTSLPNRYALNNTLEASYERAYKNNRRLCVCLMDLDDLKIYNDTHGHSAGDTLLRRFSTALSRIAQEHGLFAARYGGDEFVLIAEGRTTPQIQKTLEKLRREGGVHFSAGICNSIPDDATRPWDFFARADENMYRSKLRKELSPQP